MKFALKANLVNNSQIMINNSHFLTSLLYFIGISILLAGLLFLLSWLISSLLTKLLKLKKSYLLPTAFFGTFLVLFIFFTFYYGISYLFNLENCISVSLGSSGKIPCRQNDLFSILLDCISFTVPLLYLIPQFFYLKFLRKKYLHSENETKPVLE